MNVSDNRSGREAASTVAAPLTMFVSVKVTVFWDEPQSVAGLDSCMAPNLAERWLRGRAIICRVAGRSTE